MYDKAVTSLFQITQKIQPQMIIKTVSSIIILHCMVSAKRKIRDGMTESRKLCHSAFLRKSGGQ